MNAFVRNACGGCGRFRPGEPWTGDQCRVCWLYHHDDGCRRAWDLAPEPVVVKLRWPLFARGIALLRASGDAGVGDTVARNLERFGAKAVYERLIGGRDCGCEDRRQVLNRMFPYH